jgi:hypothetical protein
MAEDGVALVKFHTGAVSVVGGNPSEEELLAFVKEHNNRYHAGDPGGPGGHSSELVRSVTLFDSYDDSYDETKGKELDISDLL